MLASLLLIAALALPPQDTTRIVIVATTDVHGRAVDWDHATDRPFAGGITRVATVVDSLRARYPGQVVVVDAGDLIQGNPFAAYFARIAERDTNPVIRAMNLAGYDAATLGNHDFNWGLPYLRRTLAGARFPYVSGNVRAVPGGALVHPPYVVAERSGVRIGIAGFTTPGVMVWDRENVRGRLRVAPIEASALPVLRRLRRDADFAVVLVHSGMGGESSYDTTGVGPENVAAKLAGAGSRPDLVVVGHSHREVRDSVIGGVHFVQPKNWAQSVSVMHVDLVKRGGRWTPVRWHADLIPLDRVAASPRVAAALEGAHDSVARWVREPLGVATAAMPSVLSRLEPTPIIGFVHAMQRSRTGAELSAASSYDLRAGFATGPIRLGDLAAIYPYENTLRAVRISGARLEAFLEQSARYYRIDESGHARVNDSIPGYNFDMVSGASYRIDLSRPAGGRILDLRVAGRPVVPADTFTMAVNSYRQEGGGGYSMLSGAPVVYDRGENIRDLLVEEVRARRTLDPRDYADSNWSIVPAAAAAELRRLGPGVDPKAERRPVAGRVRLRILATSDLHGALEPRVQPWSRGRPVGGVVAIKRLMDSLEAECACSTVRLDAGDQMQGTLISNLSAGRATVAAFNALELDAAAIGNHDFDWSPDTLRARMREARYPWLAANIFDSATGRRPDWVVPYAIVRADSLRVAVVGYVTPETKTIVKAEHVRGLTFGSGAKAIEDVLVRARTERPDAVVIVAHDGATCDRLGCSGSILALARELAPGSVDAIVAGHTHRPVEAVVNGVPVVEARSSGTAVGVLDLYAATAPDTSAIQLLTPYADGAVGDTALRRLIAAFALTADSLGDRVVTRLAHAVPNSRRGEGPLGNLIADAQRAAVRADVAIMNNGGIRGPGLREGPVTYGELFELQPFQNGLVTLRVPGRVLRETMEFVLEDDGPAAHVSGLDVRYDPSRARGSRVVELRLGGGQRIRDGRLYTLAVNDFMAGGGSGYTMLLRFRPEPSGMTDLDALVAYLAARPTPLRVPADHRVVPVRR